MNLAELASSLVPSDDKPETLRSWRIRMALVACSGWLAQVFIVFPALFLGLPMIGRVAWSDELAAAKQTAQLAAETSVANSAAIDKLTKAQAASTADVDDLMLTVLSQRIRDSIAARCRLPASERSRITGEIENNQQLYMKRSGGQRAYEPKCNEL